MRPRPAPSARRTAISRWRFVARASMRFATFAHAMSSTNATAASMISIIGRTSRATFSRNGSSQPVQPLLVSPNRPCSSRMIDATRACACATVTLGARRATML